MDEMITRGLGAGSYPEPGNEVFMEDAPSCVRCGYDWAERLREYRGELLCPLCRETAIAREYRELHGEFTDSAEERGAFYLDFWWRSLDREERVELLRESLKGMAPKSRAALLEEYVRDNGEAFSLYIEQRGELA